MRLDQILPIARLLASNPNASRPEVACAQWIVNTFGSEVVVDAEVPEVYPGEVIITREMVGRYAPYEALLAAKAIIIAAEKARGA